MRVTVLLRKFFHLSKYLDRPKVKFYLLLLFMTYAVREVYLGEEERKGDARHPPIFTTGFVKMCQWH